MHLTLITCKPIIDAENEFIQLVGSLYLLFMYLCYYGG